MASEEMMHYGLTPYESWKISEKSGRRPSGAAIAGLVLGSVGTAAAIGAWVHTSLSTLRVPSWMRLRRTRLNNYEE